MRGTVIVVRRAYSDMSLCLWKAGEIRDVNVAAMRLRSSYCSMVVNAVDYGGYRRRCGERVGRNVEVFWCARSRWSESTPDNLVAFPVSLVV